MKNHILKQSYHKKAKKWAKILGIFPGVRAVFLSGSLARGDGNADSDIDFFIITKYGRIWTARFWVVLFLKIFRQLAKPQDHAGKICPNHFISDNSLEIKEKDLYSAEMFSQNIPLFDPQNIFAQFVHKNEKWIKEYGFVFSHTPKKEIHSNVLETQNGFLGMIQKSQEKFLRNIQIWKIQRNPEYKTPNACIVLSDTELRFHPVPKNGGRR